MSKGIFEGRGKYMGAVVKPIVGDPMEAVSQAPIELAFLEPQFDGETTEECFRKIRDAVKEQILPAKDGPRNIHYATVRATKEMEFEPKESIATITFGEPSTKGA